MQADPLGTILVPLDFPVPTFSRQYTISSMMKLPQKGEMDTLVQRLRSFQINFIVHSTFVATILGKRLSHSIH